VRDLPEIWRRRHTLAAGARVRGKLPEVEQQVWRKFVMSLSASPDGVLLVDKAEGMTSHDVVALARRKLGTKKSSLRHA